MRYIFGKGIHVTYEEAINMIDASNWSDQVKRQMMTLYAGVDTFGYSGTLDILEQQIKANGGSEAEIKGMQTYVLNTRKKIEALGISITGIHMKGLLAIDDISTAIANMEKKNKRRRQKSTFGKIYWAESERRFKCNPSLHGTCGTTFRTSVAAKTQEEVEMKILHKIRDNMLHNMKVHGSDDNAQIACIKNAIDEVDNFKTIVDRQEILLLVDNIIDQANAKIQLLTNKKMKENINRE
jgi:3-hydroxymyristoyl/3-hydroxydecanoyl-(acyl carrier protein) dehydratase